MRVKKECLKLFKVADASLSLKRWLALNGRKSFANVKHRHAKRARVIFLVIGSRSIRRTVHSNDLVKFFGGLRCTARTKLEIYNL